jgi:hypothetical protein
MVTTKSALLADCAVPDPGSAGANFPASFRGSPAQLMGHGQGLGVEVQVAPPQPHGLASAQPSWRDQVEQRVERSLSRAKTHKRPLNWHFALATPLCDIR